MGYDLNIKQGDKVFFTAAILPYGFALLARKEELTGRFIRGLGDLDYAGESLNM